MKLERITPNYYNSVCSIPNSKIPAPANAAAGSSNVETSIYKQKGVNIPFCGLAKGADIFEENCINFLRKIRQGRCRKFDEYDIKEMLKSLRQEKDSSNKESVLKEIFCLEPDELTAAPSKDLLKRTLKLTAGRGEDERFAILEFAQHELNYATKPLEAFSNLPAEKQDKLIKILKDINDINDVSYPNHGEITNQNLDEVYDFFRTLVYSEDDLSKLSGPAADRYKIDTYHLIKDDIEYFKKQDYKNENVRNKVNTVIQNIHNYFLENIL